MPQSDMSLSPADRLKEALWRQIVQLAAVDAAFRHRLETEPLAVLAAAELDAPPDIKFIFIQTSDSAPDRIAAQSAAHTVVVPLPGTEETGELDDDALENVVGGSGPSWAIPAMPPNFAALISLNGEAPALGLARPKPER